MDSKNKGEKDPMRCYFFKKTKNTRETCWRKLDGRLQQENRTAKQQWIPLLKKKKEKEKNHFLEDATHSGNLPFKKYQLEH